MPPQAPPDPDRLREFEERFRALSEHTADPISEIGWDRRLLYVSPSFTKVFGWEPEEVLGRDAMLHVHPADVARIEAAHAGAGLDRPLSELRFRYRHKNGSWRWVELTGCPYRSSSGEIRAILVNRDVTDRFEAQQQLQQQLDAERRIEELSRYFLAIDSDDFEAGIRRGLASAAELADADRVQFFVFDPESGSVGNCYQWHAPGIPEREWVYSDEIVARYRWSGARLLRGEDIAVARVHEMPDEAAAERDSLVAEGVKSYLAIPIVHRGTTIGFLDFLCMRAERAWSPQEISRLSLLADVFASALRRHRAEVSRRETEHRFRAIAEHTSDSICELDAAGAILFANPSFNALSGYTPEELNGMEAVELVHPDDREAVRRASIRDSIADGGAATVRCRIRHRDGGWRWIEATARPFSTPAGDDRFAVVVRDVTRRQQEQDDLEQQLALEQRLTRLSREFLDRGADGIDAGIRHALAAAGTLAGTDRCWLIAWGGDRDPELQSFEWCADGIAPRSMKTGLPDRSQQDWVFRQLASGEPVLVTRAADLPDESRAVRDSLLANGIQSFLAVPIRSEETLVGVLGFHSLRQEKLWSDREVNLYQLVAGLFTSALRRKRAEAHLRESEGRFRALAEHAKDPICEVDRLGAMLYASPSLTDLLGYERHELAGMNFFSIIHPDDLEAMRREYADDRPAHQPQGTLLYRARHKNGDWIVLEGTARVFHSATGDARIVAVVRDVTERQRAQQALERQLDLETRIAVLSRRFLAVSWDEIDQTIRESLADLAALAEVDRSWLTSFDVKTGSVVGLYEWHDAAIASQRQDLAQVDPSDFPWMTARILKGHVIHVPDTAEVAPDVLAEASRLRQRGVRSFLGIPLHSGSQPVGFLAFEAVAARKTWTTESITLLRLVGEIFVSALQRKRIEENLRESQQQLMQAQKMEAVGTLAGGIAHDFNNQLTVMLGNARYVMRQVADDPDLKDALTDLNRAAEHCAQLTRSLLAFSRRNAVEPRSLDVREALRQVEELLRPLIPSSIGFSVAADGDLGCVNADPTQLQQVLVNLAINARDAMPEGGSLLLTAANRAIDAEAAARFGLAEPGEYVEIGVRDSGRGIDDETMKRIFEPFFTTKPLGQGTGLGLATAYGIVSECRGAIHVESAVGSGSTFLVLLPSAPPPAPEEARDPETAATGGSGVVLVVEDESAVRRFLRSTLERNGFDVLQAANGSEALRIAARYPGRIDAVVTDVNMPETSGVDLAHALDQELPGVPVLFLSGSPDPLPFLRDADASAPHWLAKPFGEDELLDALHRLLADAARA